MRKDLKHKLDLKTDNDVWGDVTSYKVKRGLKNNNDTVNELIRKGLLSKD